MDRSCDVCGVTYTAKRSTSRYCSTRCRTRKSRGAPLAMLPQPAPASTGGVEAATVQELSAAGQLDTPLAQACIVLARRLDHPSLDTGSGVAALAARLEELLSSATRGAGGTSAPQALRDELAERRRRHGGR
jgi:hypothetical protein